MTLVKNWFIAVLKEMARKFRGIEKDPNYRSMLKILALNEYKSAFFTFSP